MADDGTSGLDTGGLLAACCKCPQIRVRVTSLSTVRRMMMALIISCGISWLVQYHGDGTLGLQACWMVPAGRVLFGYLHRQVGGEAHDHIAYVTARPRPVIVPKS